VSEKDKARNNKEKSLILNKTFSTTKTLKKKAGLYTSEQNG
jgi:hypothetical protein